jgi:hypothetical protein
MGHLERKQLKSSIRLGTLWLAEQGEGKTGGFDREDVVRASSKAFRLHLTQQSEDLRTKARRQALNTATLFNCKEKHDVLL